MAGSFGLTAVRSKRFILVEFQAPLCLIILALWLFNIAMENGLFGFNDDFP